MYVGHHGLGRRELTRVWDAPVRSIKPHAIVSPNSCTFHGMLCLGFAVRILDVWLDGTGQVLGEPWKGLRGTDAGVWFIGQFRVLPTVMMDCAKHVSYILVRFRRFKAKQISRYFCPLSLGPCVLWFWKLSSRVSSRGAAWGWIFCMPYQSRRELCFPWLQITGSDVIGEHNMHVPTLSQLLFEGFINTLSCGKRFSLPAFTLDTFWRYRRNFVWNCFSRRIAVLS